MKLERAFLGLALLGLTWCAMEIYQLRKHLKGTPENPAATDFESRLKKLEAAAPSPGVFMSAIQLHFAKLYYAAEARNWELAQFERGEILENLDVVAALRPEEHGVNIAGIAEAFKNTPLAALKDAIAVKDRSLFREAYQQCIQTCNACHQATGRPFITITVPTNPPVSNQLWGPANDGAK